MLEADFDDATGAVEMGGVATEASGFVVVLEGVFELAGGCKDVAAKEPGVGVVGIDGKRAIEVCGTILSFAELPANFAAQTPGGCEIGIGFNGLCTGLERVFHFAARFEFEGSLKSLFGLAGVSLGDLSVGRKGERGNQNCEPNAHLKYLSKKFTVSGEL